MSSFLTRSPWQTPSSLCIIASRQQASSYQPLPADQVWCPYVSRRILTSMIKIPVTVTVAICLTAHPPVLTKTLVCWAFVYPAHHFILSPRMKTVCNRCSINMCWINNTYMMQGGELMAILFYRYNDARPTQHKIEHRVITIGEKRNISILKTTTKLQAWGTKTDACIWIYGHVIKWFEEYSV